MSSSRSPRLRARLRACCMAHSPVGFAVTPPRCIWRVPCSMNTRTCSLLRSTVSTCRKSTATIPAAWACRNCRQLGPGRRGAGSVPAACRISQHGGGRDRHAGLCEFAVDPAVSPQRILLRQADDKPGDARDCRRAPWLSPLARVVLLRRQPAVPGQQRRWRHGEDFGPAPARYKPRQRGEPGPVGRLVPHPAGVPPQDRVLMPEYQQLSILRQVAAEHQDGQAEHPAREQVDDLEQHPASQPSPRQACWRKRRSATQLSIRAVQDQQPQSPMEDEVEQAKRQGRHDAVRPPPVIAAAHRQQTSGPPQAHQSGLPGSRTRRRHGSHARYPLARRSLELTTPIYDRPLPALWPRDSVLFGVFLRRST